MKDGTTQKFLALGALAGATALLVVCFRSSPARTPAAADEFDTTIAATHVDANDESPRNILNRPWFDKLPAGRKDAIDLWLFFGGGIGIEDRGSYFRSTMDVFELERQADKLDLVFLHDQKRVQTAFTVKKCDDKPPFDLCLTFTSGIRNVTKLYSWADDEDMDKSVPWARAWRASSASRARNAIER